MARNSSRGSIVYDFEVTNIPDDIRKEDLRTICAGGSSNKAQLLAMQTDTNHQNWFSATTAQIKVKDNDNGQQVGQIVNYL
jgi:hypothetical protein